MFRPPCVPAGDVNGNSPVRSSIKIPTSPVAQFSAWIQYNTSHLKEIKAYVFVLISLTKLRGGLNFED